MSWLCWIFIALCGLSLAAVSWDYSALCCSGFSLWWLLLLQRTGSRACVQEMRGIGLVAPWHVESSRTRDRTHVPCTGRQILIHCTTREAHRSLSVQCSSVTPSCPTLYNPMDCSTPGLPVHHQLPELTQTHVHRVGDVIQPSHPPSSPSPPAFNLSASGSFPMTQCFASGSQSVGVSASASVLPMNIKNWFPIGCSGLISLQSKGLSGVFSNTTVHKYQFFGTQLSL